MIDLLATLPAKEALSSVIFLLLLILVRFVGVRIVMRGRPEILSKDQRRWITRIKRASVAFAIIGIFLIWAPQLHTLALSMVAFALALVVALKEVILGITAGFVRVATTPFRVGDWIILDGHAGEVVDIDAFTIRMVEIEQTDMSYQYTGRAIAIPNAKIFTSNIVNLQNTRSYIFHDVRVVVAVGEVEPKTVFAAFKQSVQAHYAPLMEGARASLKQAEREIGVGMGQAEPLTSIQTTEFGNIILLARLYLPTAHVVDVTAAITEDTLAAAHSSRLSTHKDMIEHEEDYKSALHSAKTQPRRIA